ncbi:hypothetical protein [Olivibacter sp. XZL3]|uniref:hypothetical protein n=1 Tax=Olivibacter sp. XZL3 TaxID=1735116 RepID=UPI001066C1A2|nr:hypothetical protein [Olivibacter sp. XZL3]
MSTNLLLEELDIKTMPQIEVEKMLNVLLQAIVPNINSRPSYSIRILNVTGKSSNTFYRAEKQVEGKDWEPIAEFGTEQKDVLLKLEESEIATEETVRDWVLGKVEASYFDIAKNALQIFRDCSTELNGKVRPLFLANALKACNGTKGLPKLIKKKDRNGRFVYLDELRP